MDENTELLVRALAKNPEFIKGFWALANGFVNNTTIEDNWQARAGYEALHSMEDIIRAAQSQVVRIPTVRKTPQFEERQCARCHKLFRTNNSSDLCYNCTLDDITHGLPPEEGDFNTAGIISGTLTDSDWTNLQHDLEMVEAGTSEFEPDDEREFLDIEEEETDDWEYNEHEDAKFGHEG